MTESARQAGGFAAFVRFCTPAPWMQEAACRGLGSATMYPERGASTREAKAVCRECVVRVQCLEYALTNREKFGIWGGMSERERRRLRRSRKGAA